MGKGLSCFPLLLVWERVSFFSCSRKGCHFLKMFQGRVNFCKSWSRKGYFFFMFVRERVNLFKVFPVKGHFFQSLYGQGSPFVKVWMGKGMLELKIGMGKGLIFQIIGMATERVRDPGPSLPVPFQEECPPPGYMCVITTRHWFTDRVNSLGSHE